jgi:hypothetical protein
MRKRTNNSTRSNTKSTTKVDKALLQHLLSPDRLESISFLEKNGVVSFCSPESKQKAKNRLAYLKRIQESEDFTVFIELCKANNLDSLNLIKQKIEFEDDSDSFGSSDEEDEDEDIEVEQAPTRKIKNISMKPNMSYQELGKIISIDLPNGLIFCTAWVDAKLDPNILEIVVAEDGMSVLEKTKMPEPKSGSALVSMYGWASDENNMVVQSLNAVLKRLKKELTSSSKWDTKVLMRTQEEVMREFVDIDGKPTSHIPYMVDADGRQRICFFLKTLRAHEQIPQAAKFVAFNGGAHPRRAMHTDDDDISIDDSFSDGNAASVHAEVDEKLNKMATDMQNHTSNMRNEIRGDVENMMKQFIQQMHQYQMQGDSASQQGPVPEEPKSY